MKKKQYIIPMMEEVTLTMIQAPLLAGSLKAEIESDGVSGEDEFIDEGGEGDPSTGW